jgi:Tol biopolymer transport system component
MIESRDRQGEHVTTLVSESHAIGATSWLPDGRIIYSRFESPTNVLDANLWAIRTNVETGEATGKPRRITDWAGSGVPGYFNASTDGKRLALVKASSQADVYVAELQANGTRLKTPRRLTLDERNDWLRAWTPDSKAVVFMSDRNGPVDIYTRRRPKRWLPVLKINSSRD